MENSHQKPLATESFSYSWLVDQNINSHSPSRNPPDNIFDNIIGPILPENSHQKDHMTNFNFDVPTRIITSPQRIVPAVYNNDLRHLQRSYTSVPLSPFSYSTPWYNNDDDSSKKLQHVLLQKWRRSSKRILQKCVGFVKQLQLGSSRKSCRVDDLERKVCEVRSCVNSVEASPRRTCANTTTGGGYSYRVHDHFLHGLKKVKSWNGTPRSSPLPAATPARSRYVSAWTCHDRDVESSIHEAIQYCKRSIEK